MIDFKKKAASRTIELHAAHSELESIARQADEADLGEPDEVAAISMLIDELLSVSGGQKLRLKQAHSNSVGMLREFVASQLAAGAEDRARREELEVSKSLFEKKAERDALELEERAERERKLQAEVFRLGEALEAKNSELNEAKPGSDAAMQEKDARIAQLTHEVNTLRQAADAAQRGTAQANKELEQQARHLTASPPRCLAASPPRRLATPSPQLLASSCILPKPSALSRRP